MCPLLGNKGEEEEEEPVLMASEGDGGEVVVGRGPRRSLREVPVRATWEDARTDASGSGVCAEGLRECRDEALDGSRRESKDGQREKENGQRSVELFEAVARVSMGE